MTCPGRDEDGGSNGNIEAFYRLDWDLHAEIAGCADAVTDPFALPSHDEDGPSCPLRGAEIFGLMGIGGVGPEACGLGLGEEAGEVGGLGHGQAWKRARSSLANNRRDAGCAVLGDDNARGAKGCGTACDCAQVVGILDAVEEDDECGT